VDAGLASYQTRRPWDWFGGLYRPMLGPQGSVYLFLRLLT